MEEIEAKIRVDDLAVVRQRLKELEADYVGRYIESNHLCDRHDGFLRHHGSGLRVRLVAVLQGRQAAPTLTFKGPLQDSAIKRREEIEVEVSDADDTLALLAGLGFETVMSYRKTRERWTLGDCSVELDEVPLLGTFVEIEGPSEAAVADIQERVGLGSGAHVRKGYPGMLRDACTKDGRSTIGIGFD